MQQQNSEVIRTHRFYRAATANDERSVRSMLESAEVVDINAAPGEGGATALYAVCMQGICSMAQLLLDARASPNNVGDGSQHACVWADFGDGSQHACIRQTSGVGSPSFVGVFAAGGEPLWDVYGLAHQNYTQRRAYQLGIGNHEAWYNWTATTHRYPTAQSDVPAVSGAAPPFWYTFVAGGVHWTMLSTEHDYSPGSVQYTFVDAALAAVDRKVTPWSAVAFHRPMYSSDKSEYDGHKPGCSIQVHLEPLMLRHKVDLVFTGHQHAYERVHPNIAGNVTSMPTPLAGLVDPFGANTAYVRPGAPVYLLGGNGGAVQDFSWVDPAPSWSAVRLSSGCDFSGGRHCIPDPRSLTDTYGYVHAEFFNRTHARLHTEMVTKGQPHDGFWLIRADGA